jgi:ATP-dependent RNA helicase RhlE
MNFSQLGLAPAQVRSCESLGYTEPTPIQQQGIPVILSGQDLIGCAETGTGKTAAFLLPIIQMITEPIQGAKSTRKHAGSAKESLQRKVRVLVLAPTRELAAQIEKNYIELNPIKANRSVTLIGGASMPRQLDELRRSPAVVIATPGRLLDLTERRALDLSGIEVLVLDEADRMLDMGFLPAIRRVLSMVPEKRDATLFGDDVSGN